MPGEIIVHAWNPEATPLEEAEEVAAAIRELQLGCDVRAEEGESKKSRTGSVSAAIDLLYIVLAGGTLWGGKVFVEEVAKKTADAFVDWARKRFERRKPAHPVYARILGPDGRVVKSVVVKNAVDKPQDRTDEDRENDRFLEKPAGRWKLDDPTSRLPGR